MALPTNVTTPSVPAFTSALQGVSQVWGDFAETTEPMRENLFLVNIRLPPAIASTAAARSLKSTVLSTLASGVTLPEESLMIEEVATKLSTYDVVVGKEKGSFAIKFKEQMGAPVTSILSEWHKYIIDARGSGIEYAQNFRTDIWVAALTGKGTPFYWWLLTGAFPKVRGNPTNFDEENKTSVKGEVPFSYIEMFDGAEAVAGAGANWTAALQNLI